jgi:tetratricopeptide (TPR) repeat protein
MTKAQLNNPFHAQLACLRLTLRKMIATMHWIVALSILVGASLFAATSENARVGENHIDTARREFQKGNFAAARAALDRFEKAGKPTVESYDLRGCIETEQGNFSDAAKSFASAHDTNQSIFAPRLHAGDSLLRQKQYPEARGVYETLLKETNIIISSERLRYAILLTYLGEKNEDAAKRTFEQITFPTESPAYYYAQAAWAFAHGNQRDAQKWLKSAEKIYDTGVTSWFARPLYDFGWIKNKPPPTTS